MAFQFNNAEIATTDETSISNTRQAIIGGSNSTVLSNDTIVVGSSTSTVNLNPLSGKLFIKDNPVYIKNRVIKTVVGTVSATDISYGVIEIQTSGVYTFDSTVNIRNRVYDQSGTPFSGAPTVCPTVDLTVYNSSGSTVTINAGTGQTFTNGTSLQISSLNSKTVKMLFTSNSTMLIEDLQVVVPTVTLGDAGGGGSVSLVNDGVGPALLTKGLTAGSNISLIDGGTDVTINATVPTTTLTNASAPILGEAGLTVDGTGPTLSVKKLVAGSNVTITDNVNDVVISASGGGGLTEPLFTTGNRAVIAGNSNSFVGVSATSYGTTVGGYLTTSTLNGTSRGCVNVGGSNNPATTFSAGTDGSVSIGGDTKTTTFNIANGCVNIGGGGSLDSASNLVLIGGSNTTIGSTNGSVCIGSSALTTTLRPNVSKTYIKDSPVLIQENTVINIVGVILATDIAKGVVEIQTSGAYTFDSTVNIRNAVLDATGTAFVGNVRPYFRLTLYNTSGGTVTISPGAGQTFTNNATIRVKNTSSRTINWWFTSNTTMIVEDLVTYLNDGSGVSLVQTADGPEIEVKGLIAGTDISIVSAPSSVTITNSSPASSVTLTSAGGTTLVNDGTGPALAVKGLVANSGFAVTNNPTNLAIGPQALYGIYQYQTADGVNGAIYAAGVRNLVSINTTQAQNGMTRAGTTMTLTTAGKWYISGKVIVRNAGPSTAYITSVGGGTVLLIGITQDTEVGIQVITSVDGVITSAGVTNFEVRVYTNTVSNAALANSEALGVPEAYANLTCLYLGA